MKAKYEIELADNGMIVRRPDIGEVRCIKYKECENERSIAPVAQWIGEDILDEMFESPIIKEEINNLMKNEDSDGINDFEIIVEIKPVLK